MNRLTTVSCFASSILLFLSIVGCNTANSTSNSENFSDTVITEIKAESITEVSIADNLEADMGTGDITGFITTTEVENKKDFIENFDNAIDSYKNIEELNLHLNSIDTENRINEVRVYESPNAYAADITLSDGNFNIGNIIHIIYDDEKNYILSWGEREFHPIPMMLSCIIARSDKIEQLMAEMEGYNLGLDKEQRLTGIYIYENYEDALNSSGCPIEIIMDNGKWIATEEAWENEGAIRVVYSNGKSWFCLQSKGEII